MMFDYVWNKYENNISSLLDNVIMKNKYFYEGTIEHLASHNGVGFRRC